MGSRAGEYGMMRIDTTKGFELGNIQIKESIERKRRQKLPPNPLYVNLSGMSTEERQRLINIKNKRGRSLVNVFNTNLIRLNRQGILWNLTFDQWLNLWRRSGKLNRMGCLKGEYRLVRIDLTKGFELGNVRILDSASSMLPDSLSTHRLYGISVRAYRQARELVNRDGKRLLIIYNLRRHYWRGKGVRWTLTFTEWLKAWNKSFKTDLIGVDRHYTLAWIIPNKGFVRGNVRVAKLIDVHRQPSDEYCQATYGMTQSQYLKVKYLVNRKDARSTLVKIYSEARYRYQKNGVGWALTFPQWLKIWKKSGHIRRMGGLTGQYLLKMIDAKKGFKPGNVHIVQINRSSVIKKRTAAKRSKDKKRRG